jgi:hypothetical protein
LLGVIDTFALLDMPALPPDPLEPPELSSLGSGAGEQAATAANDDEPTKTSFENERMTTSSAG